MKTSEKDASDMLVKGKAVEFISAFYDAEGRRPKGIVTGSSISLDRIKKVTSPGYMTGYPELDKMLGGLRKGELTTLTAGSGIGKSTLARELGYRLRVQDLTIGNLFLEEPLEKTIQGYIAIDNNVKLSSLRANPNILSPEQWQQSYDKLIANKWIGLEHFGSLPTEELLDKMRYLVYGEGCDFIILDHLSMVMSGQVSDNERKDIDLVMTELAAFVNESKVGILSVVHLSRNKGKASFNEGGQVSLNDLRGSAALEQLSWNVLALERDQQDVTQRDMSNIRILKAREEGWTGLADICKYNTDTGRLLAIPNISLSGEY
jgi:twinkle protein